MTIVIKNFSRFVFSLMSLWVLEWMIESGMYMPNIFSYFIAYHSGYTRLSKYMVASLMQVSYIVWHGILRRSQHMCSRIFTFMFGLIFCNNCLISKKVGHGKPLKLVKINKNFLQLGSHKKWFKGACICAKIMKARKYYFDLILRGYFLRTIPNKFLRRYEYR